MRGDALGAGPTGAEERARGRAGGRREAFGRRRRWVPEPRRSAPSAPTGRPGSAARRSRRLAAEGPRVRRRRAACEGGGRGAERPVRRRRASRTRVAMMPVSAGCHGFLRGPPAKPSSSRAPRLGPGARPAGRAGGEGSSLAGAPGPATPGRAGGGAPGCQRGSRGGRGAGGRDPGGGGGRERRPRAAAAPAGAPSAAALPAREGRQSVKSEPLVFRPSWRVGVARPWARGARRVRGWRRR